uniref:Uncharacterized protein n=1 Tax=Panagrolaimus superbus TaxID=310955 RepID=A0A914YQH4_9BILA
MSPQQPQQQEEQQQQHFKHPTIKISPSKSKSISISEEHGTLPKDEMYDDQFETQNIRTTISPEDKIKQLEEDMDDLESQITKKLHSGEVSFNKVR